MHYEILINGNSTTPGRALPILVIEELTRIADNLDAKIMVKPLGGFLYSMYLYNTSSHESLLYLFTKVTEVIRNHQIDVVCSTLHKGKAPFSVGA